MRDICGPVSGLQWRLVNGPSRWS